MNKFSFRQKLWLPLVISFVALTSISVFNAYQAREIRVEGHENNLVSVTAMAMSLVEQYDGLTKNDTLSRDAAQKQAIDRFKALRHDKDGYFTITSSNNVMVMHPIKPGFAGKDQSGFKDAQGNAVYAGLTTAAKDSKSGFTSYIWPKVGSMDLVPRTAFTMRYEPWDRVPSTGVYMDDINTTFMTSLYQTSGLLLLVGGLLMLLDSVANHNLQHALGGDPAYAADVASRIAGDDPTVKIATHANDNDSLLYAASRMHGALVDTVSRIKGVSETIGTAMHEIASDNLDLSSRTERQTSSLEEAASAVEQLISTMQQDTDNAQQANQLAASASGVAVRGGDVVTRVVETMGSISASSREIVDIIGMIGGIAFQTNILVLNVAMEAARVGEQDRGFAVVADEMRNLMQRSATAAKEIKALIDDSVVNVDAGSALVEEADTVMREIIASAKCMTDIVGEISSASQEQRSGIREVSHAVTQLDDVAQQNVALVEEAAATTQSLEGQAVNLAQVMAQSRLDAHTLYAPAMVARVEPEAVPVKSVTGTTSVAPKEKTPRREATESNTEAARPKLTSRKPPVLRKATAKPVERTEKKSAAPAAVPASLTKTKPLVAAGGGTDWETF